LPQSNRRMIHGNGTDARSPSPKAAPGIPSRECERFG
jgi:hypothetical protein